MLSRLAAALLVTALVVQGEGAAFAQDPAPPPASSASAPAPAPAPAPPPPPASSASAAPAPPVTTVPPATQPHGAIVVAASEGAAPAARALAFDVYRDPDLRPTIDDAMAKALAGDAPADGAPARIKEMAELRASIPKAGAEPIARRVLASIGTELGAVIVIAVTMDGNHAIARALKPGTAAFERVELGATVEVGADGTRTFRWPGATATLHNFLPGAPTTPAAPLAPKKEEAPAPAAPAEPKPFYKSAWFWGSVGGAAALGLSVFLISKATSSAHDVHLSGTVGP